MSTIHSFPSSSSGLPQTAASPTSDSRVSAAAQSAIRSINMEPKEAFLKKLGSFTAFNFMRHWAGVENNDSLPLLQWSHESISPSTGTPKTVWEIFLENHKNITLFQKFLAGLCYLLLYQTSMIDNTVKGYLNVYLNKFEENLRDPTKRAAFFQIVLTQAHEFLLADQNATKIFATKETGKSLEMLRNEAIDNQYAGDIDTLTRNFNEKILTDPAFKISIFAELQKIPLFGRSIFGTLETFINRYIIRRILKDLLPNTLKTTIDAGIASTAPTAYPFKVAITRYLNGRLEAIQASLKSPTQLPKEILPENSSKAIQLNRDIVRNLKDSLYEVLKTEKLSEKEIKEFFSKNETEHAETTQKLIEAFENGLHYVLSLLDEMAENGQLADTLYSACASTFDVDITKTQDKWKAELSDENGKFEKNLQKTIDQLVNSGVDDYAFPQKSRIDIRKQDFEDKKETIKKLLTSIEMSLHNARSSALCENVQAFNENMQEANDLLQSLLQKKEAFISIENGDWSENEYLKKAFLPIIDSLKSEKFSFTHSDIRENSRKKKLTEKIKLLDHLAPLYKTMEKFGEGISSADFNFEECKELIKQIESLLPNHIFGDANRYPDLYEAAVKEKTNLEEELKKVEKELAEEETTFWQSSAKALDEPIKDIKNLSQSLKGILSPDQIPSFSSCQLASQRFPSFSAPLAGVEKTLQFISQRIPSFSAPLAKYDRSITERMISESRKMLHQEAKDSGDSLSKLLCTQRVFKATITRTVKYLAE